MHRQVLAVLLPLLLAALPVAAQVPAPPAGATFRDPDPAAHIHFRDLDTTRGIAKLERHLEKQPDDPRGWSASAFRHSLKNDAEAALAELAKARALVGSSERRQRELLWSTGWIHFNLGDYAAASAAWIEAVKTHGGQPWWVPHSFAVLAELAGERETALAWFTLAAQNSPSVWGTRRGTQRYVRSWNELERAAALRLYEAMAVARDADG